MRWRSEMARRLRHRVGVLVVRVWIERNGEGWRARITSMVNVHGGRRIAVTSTSAEHVCRVVTDWLGDYTSNEHAE